MKRKWKGELKFKRHGRNGEKVEWDVTKKGLQHSNHTKCYYVGCFIISIRKKEE